MAVVELPQSLRAKLKEPLGPVFTDAEALLDRAGAPLVAVGDVVTYHLLAAGRVPDVALVDGRTERSAVDDEIRDGIGGFDREVRVANPPATLTDELLEALTGGLDSGETTLLVVDGEEDLATLPAVVAATRGSAVVYGQPGEGMVLVTVDRQAADRARELLARMDGDTDRLWALLGTDRAAQD